MDNKMKDVSVTDTRSKEQKAYEELEERWDNSTDINTEEKEGFCEFVCGHCGKRHLNGVASAMNEDYLYVLTCEKCGKSTVNKFFKKTVYVTRYMKL